MELHPILEHGGCPNPGLWYVLSALGDAPSVRVGHTATYAPNGRHGGKVYLIGGANPSGSFSDVFVLDLETFSWDVVDSPGLRARYEHSAFTVANDNNKIYVFAGADQGRNHSDIQSLDVATETWATEPVAHGNAPSPRTYHVSMTTPARFVVYSGGQSGADPVGDRQVHAYDVTTATWATVTVRGDPPKPRHGHLTATVGNKLVVHGGMSGQTFYDDLHVLDLDRNTWTTVKQKKVYPCARAAHAGAVVGSDLYVFGGMSRQGALDDLYKLDTVTLKWTRIAVEGPPPAPRLDLAMTAVRLRVPATPLAPSVGDVLTASGQAKEVLDAQLRMGSAGSTRSSTLSAPSSAGSQRSVTTANPASPGSAGSERSMTQEDRDALCIDGVRPPQTSSPPPPGAESPDDVPHKIVDLLLLSGGMDTEGEIFDDTMVFMVAEQPDATETQDHGK